MKSLTHRETHSRWRLIRDALVFQGKLVLDGLMDIALGPLSLIAALVGLLGQGYEAEGLFYRVLRLGRRFEVWVNLFGSAPPEENSGAGECVDAHVERLERFLAEQVRQGGMTAQVKARIDAWLDAVPRSRSMK